MAKLTSKSKASLAKSKARPVKSKARPEKLKTVTVELNAGTAIFFQNLVRKGMAEFELNPKLGSKVMASTRTDKEGKLQIIVNAALICWAPEDLGK